jgi:hypothetical protein
MSARAAQDVKPTLLRKVAAGCISGAVAAFVANPIETVKVRMQGAAGSGSGGVGETLSVLMRDAGARGAISGRRAAHGARRGDHGDAGVCVRVCVFVIVCVSVRVWCVQGRPTGAGGGAECVCMKLLNCLGAEGECSALVVSTPPGVRRC